METTTPAVITEAEPTLTPGQRLLADAPIFWKIVSLVCGGLMLVCAIILRYKLLPQFSGIIVDLVGPGLSAGWIVSQFAAKTPPPKSLSFSDLYDYYSRLSGVIKPAEDAAHTPFTPDSAPDVNAVFVQLKDLDGQDAGAPAAQ